MRNISTTRHWNVGEGSGRGPQRHVRTCCDSLISFPPISLRINLALHYRNRLEINSFGTLLARLSTPRTSTYPNSFAMCAFYLDTFCWPQKCCFSFVGIVRRNFSVFREWRQEKLDSLISEHAERNAFELVTLCNAFCSNSSKWRDNVSLEFFLNQNFKLKNIPSIRYRSGLLLVH